jgi:predicted nucleic acid-binding Zn ribbon protein
VTHSRRSPRPLGFALEQIETELAPATLLSAVQQTWRETVGEAIAGHATPTSERGGVLTISCSASVWAQELDLMSVAIVKRLNGRLKEGRISRLRCITAPPPDAF